MPFTFKETGESYEMWLARNRGQEIKAKEHLPENVKRFKEYEMEERIQDLLEDPQTENWGYMNAWSSDEHSMYKHLSENGVRFTKVQRNGYWLYFNEKEKITFKVDSGD